MVLPYQEIYQSGVLLMAMSYGVPSLVSDISPFKEIISDQSNGFLFESNNLTDLSQKINSIISDDNTLELVANQSVETMKNKHNWVKIAKCYLELF